MSSITIPDSVTAIGRNAFQGCSSLTSVVIPSGVDSLSNELFLNCSNLTGVTIPAGVEMPGTDVFKNCDRLKTINFAGSQQQWNNIYATVAKNALAQTGDYTINCTKMAKLSNGTVRYYGVFPKVSKTASYWFTYTDEMFVN